MFSSYIISTAEQIARKITVGQKDVLICDEVARWLLYHFSIFN